MTINNIEITVVRSKRKTVAIQITPDLTVTVRAPRSVSEKEIERILREKEAWIVNNLEKMKKKKRIYEGICEEKALQPLTKEEIEDLAGKALKYIPQRVEYFSKIVGVNYGRITIRNQRTRWGSCSSKGNLNFNCLLMLTPPEVSDYVVVHELCHRKEMNHSKAFWGEVEKVLPEYKKSVNWLKNEGRLLCHLK